jgi:transposase
VTQINHAADTAEDVLRISMDAKATVNVGPFARGGKSRVQVQGADHDFKPLATVTPVGIFLPTLHELFVYGVTSKVTSDCLVDRLIQWWEAVRERFVSITTLVINVDNGPENHSRRTQFMQRMVEFVQQYRVTVRLAYYPPYHSKYNPIERCWGILENHWNGTLLDSIDTVLRCARTMTWNGKHPCVELVTTTYQTGVTLTQEAMEAVEAQIKRLPALEKWFVDIVPPSRAIWDT